jgi:TonB family protein
MTVLVSALALWVVIPTLRVSAQDALAHAKELYLSASYDEALAVLDGLQTGTARDIATEVAQYRVFCLLALNRSDEARKAIESMVSLDPFYRPSDTQVSPRIRTAIQETRKALLPTIVQRSYAEAKAAFERKDPQAAKLFEGVLALLEDPDMKSLASTADLRTVASGFRDLSTAVATAALPPPRPPAPPAPEPAAAVAEPVAAPQQPVAAPQQTAAPAIATQEPSQVPPVRATGPPAPVPAAAQLKADSGVKVVPPVTLSQSLPPWEPPNVNDARLEFKGSVEVTIDEGGNVTNAVLRESVHPVYNARLLQMARTWKYKPATRNGVPISFQKLVEIDLQPVR